MAKSVVSVVKGTDPDRMVEDALAHLGGVEAFFKPGATVVIKPNGGHEYTADTAVCTSPAVVAAVIKAVRKGKPGEIILAESAATGCDSLRCLEVSGIRAAAEEAGVDRVVDIKREKDLITVPIPDAKSDIKEVKLPRFLLEADLVVNVPIFKSHASMVFSCALKNIKGVVQDFVHFQMHQTDLAAAMMDVWSVMKNVNLTIADMIHPQEGFGPHCGVPADFGCIVASADPVALDSVACRMVGLDADRVDYFRAALERGLGNIMESDIEIRGNTIEEVYKPLWLPYMAGFGAWPEYNINVEGACSSCQSLAAFTFVRLQAMGQYEANQGIDFLVGKKKHLPAGVKPGKNLILMGNCLRSLKAKIENSGGECVYIDGCPPGEPFPYTAIVERESQPSEKISRPEGLAAFREQLEAENVVFIEWLKKQSAAMRRRGTS